MTLKDVCAEIEASNASPEIKAILQRIATTADYAKLSKEQKAAYDKELKLQRDFDSSIKQSERRGRAEGLAQGREEGREEEALKIARNMKDKGYAVEDIVEMTGLSEGQVAGLGKRPRYGSRQYSSNGYQLR